MGDNRAFLKLVKMAQNSTRPCPPVNTEVRCEYCGQVFVTAVGGIKFRCLFCGAPVSTKPKLVRETKDGSMPPQ